MIVKVTAKKVIINFTAVHVGHLKEVIRMRLPFHQRATAVGKEINVFAFCIHFGIAWYIICTYNKFTGKLRDGVKVQCVLDDIRDTGISNGNNFERLYYIRKSDIYNIIRDNNISYTTRLHTDDVYKC